jgi:hypothetical protein
VLYQYPFQEQCIDRTGSDLYILGRGKTSLQLHHPAKIVEEKLKSKLRPWQMSITERTYWDQHVPEHWDSMLMPPI